MLSLTQTKLNPSASIFDHEFNGGEITVALGANNSGKTNLCRLIAGLDSKAEGNVEWNGARRGDGNNFSVALVYQAFINYPNFTVAQNIASGVQQKDKQQVQSRVADIAGKLQIDAFLDRYPNELSGGQQQRLAIGRALAREADVLLLDEPLVNLDFKLREALQIELRQLLRDTKTTVIYTSTDPKDAFALGDEVLLLDNGNKVQHGPPLELYQSPTSLQAMDLLSEPGVNWIHQDDVVLGIRPEHLQLDDHQEPNKQVFDFLIGGLETSGDETFLHGQVAGETWVVRTLGMLDTTLFKVGQTIAVSAYESDIRSFSHV